MSTKANRDNQDIGMLIVRDMDVLIQRGYEIIRIFPMKDEDIIVRAKIPTHIGRNELDKDENIVSYQLYPSRH